MENVTIVNGRENELEFDINIQGANKKEPMIRFVIEGKPINFGFHCQHGEADNWSAIIPAIPQLKNKSYPFRLEVIVDGYYFEPFRGTVDVIAEPDVSAKDIHTAKPEKPVVSAVNVKNDEDKKSTKKKTVSKKEVTKEDVDIEEPETIIPEEIVEEPKDDFSNMAEIWLNREKPVVTEKDKKVKNVIKELTNQPSIRNFKTTTSKITDGTNEELDKIVKDAEATVPVTEPVSEESELSEKTIKILSILSSLKD